MYSASFLPGGLSEGSAFSLDYPQRPGKLSVSFAPYGLFSGQAFWAESERHAVTENHPRGKAGLRTGLYGSQVWHCPCYSFFDDDRTFILLDVPRNQEAKKLPWYDGGNRKYYCDYIAVHFEHNHAFGMGSDDELQYPVSVIHRKRNACDLFYDRIGSQHLSEQKHCKGSETETYC